MFNSGGGFIKLHLVWYSGTEAVLALSSQRTGRAGLTSPVDRGPQVVARGVIVADQVVELVLLLLTLYGLMLVLAVWLVRL